MQTLRSAILINNEQAELLSAHVLSKQLIEHIADALQEVGVQSLDVAGAAFYPEVSGRFSNFTQLGAREGIAAELRKYRDGITFVFSSPALVDAAALSELRAEAEALGATVLMSTSRPLIYAVPSEVTEQQINSILSGSTAEFCITDIETSAGIAKPVASLSELSKAEDALRERVNTAHIRAGVRITGLSSVYISVDAQIGAGTHILPNTIINGTVKIGKSCVIGPNTVIENCEIGDGTAINSSQILDSTVGNGTTVGPFSYIRQHCVIGDGCRIGDFVEMKNSNIGNKTKSAHLTYIGDADVGERVNFGCGTVISNYDGVFKHRTTIGDDAFIGGNTNLIAPVTVGERSYTAAGTTVTQNVPAEHLAIGRVRQENKPGWWERMAKKREAAEQQK